MRFQNLRPDSLIDMKFMINDTGFSKQFFYNQMKVDNNPLPKPVKMGRSSRWLYCEFQSWKQAYIDSSRRG